MSTQRFRPSPSMVVAFLAMTVALGGTSYAVTKLPARSVGSKQLKKKAVGTANIKDKAVTGAKVKDNSLTGADINEGSLGQVPSAAAAGNATRAATAGNADHANAAAALDRVSFRSQSVTIPAATLEVPGDPSSAITTHGEVSASCPQGQVVVGGGAKVEAPNIMAIDDSYPGPGATAWTAHAGNDDPDAPHTLTVTVICVAAGGTN